MDADGHEIDVSRNRSLALTLIGGALCGDSDIEELSGRWTYRGDPTEAALVTLAAKAGLIRSDVLGMFPRVAEFPFEPERRRMTTIHKRGRQAVAYTKGAPELIIARSTAIHLDGAAYTLTDRTRKQLLEVSHRLAEQGLRMIAVAYREFPEMPARFDVDEIERDLVFAGLCGVENRATPESVSAFNLCAAAGIRTVIVTGDDPATASDLALSMGMSGEIFEGGAIDAMPLDELCEKMRKARVCANISPLEKRAIVTALKHRWRHCRRHRHARVRCAGAYGRRYRRVRGGQCARAYARQRGYGAGGCRIRGYCPCGRRKPPWFYGVAFLLRVCFSLLDGADAFRLCSAGFNAAGSVFHFAPGLVKCFYGVNSGVRHCE